jgi:hypothetical protein
MDGLTLLQEARTAGLTVEADGERLRIRGPRGAKDLAQRLLANKSQVLAAQLVTSCFTAWAVTGRKPMLSPLADAVDLAFVAGDLERLRKAVVMFLKHAAKAETSDETDQTDETLPAPRD